MGCMLLFYCLPFAQLHSQHITQHPVTGFTGTPCSSCQTNKIHYTLNIQSLHKYNSGSQQPSDVEQACARIDSPKTTMAWGPAHVHPHGRLENTSGLSLVHLGILRLASAAGASIRILECFNSCHGIAALTRRANGPHERACGESVIAERLTVVLLQAN